MGEQSRRIGKAPVSIGRPGQDGVSASSVLILISLAVEAGEEVVIVSEDAAALATIGDLIAADDAEA